MKGTAVFLFVAFCASASALSSPEDRKKPAATVIPADAFGASTEGPKPTTTKPTTTKAHNTTTPPTPHNTTTPAPPHNTTTPAPPHNTTTPSPPHNTTTPSPPHNTTTAAPPTPKPAPGVPVGNYTLMMDKSICLMVQMGLQIRLVSAKLNGTFILQPNHTKPDGFCKDPLANLTLTFKQGHITFMFNKSVADNSVYVNALSFYLSSPFAKGGNEEYEVNNKTVHLFPAKVGNSYSCKNVTLFMGDGLYMDFSQDRMQAFNLTASHEFGLPDPCEADKPDYRVAIAVGITLLVLILIVVVVYLLGRRRRTDGYQAL